MKIKFVSLFIFYLLCFLIVVIEKRNIDFQIFVFLCKFVVNDFLKPKCLNKFVFRLSTIKKVIKNIFQFKNKLN